MELKGLMKKYIDVFLYYRKIINYEDIRAIIEPIALDYCDRVISIGGNNEEDYLAYLLRFMSVLEDVFLYFPEDKALAIFKSIDSITLSRRHFLIKFFTDRNTPFYTLKEFTNLIEMYRTQLVCNRGSLLKTGFPKTSFEESEWFDRNLGYLYFVKLPLFIEGNPSPWHRASMEEKENKLIQRNEKNNIIYNYIWINDDPRYDWMDKDDVIVCKYENAAGMMGLTNEMTHRLEKNRGKYFDLKIDIIDTLLNCLKSSSNSIKIWEDSLQIFTRTFTKEEMKFYFEIDSILRMINVGDYLESLYFAKTVEGLLEWGTLTDLISIVGHVEKELSIGTFHKTKLKILKLFPDYNDLKSYCQIFGTSIQKSIDRILDNFSELEKSEKKFWEDFDTRVNIAIEKEFETEVTIHFRAKTQYVARFKALVQNFADWEATHLREAGKFASIEEIFPERKIKPVLYNNQKKDYEKCEYKCYDEIHITGNSSIYRSNEIIVNGIKIKIGDSIFLLLLRLVVELKKEEGGWVDRNTLYKDRIIRDPDKFQIYSNLRTALQGNLLDKNARKFIENDGSKSYRISTHPDFITYNKEKLLNHPPYKGKKSNNVDKIDLAEIKDIAKYLP